ncbi:hypothetical protein E8E13_005484 [Curvularia kusanoi]|uniref:Uncharacterized protein n=1 Tax=Curvularia kusanoi TaxID=90978 RepID=A0A9P4W595_CURKU|nr:hypothetical protein E8E13_005484 [Curvularia kusanoi]
MLLYRPSFEFRPSIALPIATSQECAVTPDRSRATGGSGDSGRHGFPKYEAADAKLQSRLQSMLNLVRQANLGKEAVVPLEDFMQQIQLERDEAEASLELRARSAVACFMTLMVHAPPDAMPGSYDTKATQTNTPIVPEASNDLTNSAPLEPFSVKLHARQQPERLSRFDQADGLHPVLTQAIPRSIQHMPKDGQEKIMEILRPSLQLNLPSEAVQKVPSLAHPTNVNPGISVNSGLQTHKGDTSLISTSNENARAQKAAKLDPCPSIQTRSCDYGLSTNDRTVVVKLPPKAKSEVTSTSRSKTRALDSPKSCGASNGASPLRDAISGFCLGHTAVMPNSPTLMQAATNKQHDSELGDPAKTTCERYILGLRSTRSLEDGGKAVLGDAKVTTGGDSIVMPERAKTTTNLLLEQDPISVAPKRAPVRYQGPDHFLGLLDLIKKR